MQVGHQVIEFQRLQAVIWDMDGVLVDSEPIHRETWHATFKKFNMPVYPERLRRSFGMTSEMVVEMMADVPLSAHKIAEICAEKARLFQQAIMVAAHIFPGVLGWLDSFRQNGVRQALASSGTPQNIALILEKLEIEGYFDVIVSGKDLPSKPEPFIFLKAADQLGVNPLQCLVIEDSVAGVKAAKAAGMHCLAVTTSSPADALAEADLVLENLTQLMSAQIQTLFSA